MTCYMKWMKIIVFYLTENINLNKYYDMLYEMDENKP